MRIFELLYQLAETVDDAEGLAEIIEELQKTINEQQELIDEYRKRFAEQDAIIKRQKIYISLN